MYALKGFISIPALTNNAVGKIAQFGELSPKNLTASRDIREYSNTATPAVLLNSFYCVNDSLQRVEPSPAFTLLLLSLGQWVYTQYSQNLIPSNDNKQSFIQGIRTQFSQLTVVNVDSIEESNDVPGKRMPTAISFRAQDGGLQYQVSLWFSDEKFTEQYDEYEIFIIPPVTPIDFLKNGKVAVYNKILELSSAELIDQIEAIRGDAPDTRLVGYNTVWHDYSNPVSTMTTTWTVIIYGNAGFDQEVIKEQIRLYILNNSTDQTIDWSIIYPELYSETEFAFFPMWDRLSLPTDALPVGIYAPMIKHKYVRDVAIEFMPTGYTSNLSQQTLLDGHLFTGVSSYRTLTFGCLGNPNNVDGKLDITQLYPDLNTAINPLEDDFGRMDVTTQNFLTTLNIAFDAARTYTPTGIVPPGLTKVIRRGLYFISFNSNGFNYIVLTRYSFNRARNI